MIFVTVGAQMAFDRLIRAIDEWAGQRGRKNVFAQIGPSDYRPRNIEWTRFISPPDFLTRVEASSLLVAHAGMGSILTALELGKPILVMPRRGSLQETRNDHQVATAKRFLEQGRVTAAFDERELIEKMDQLHTMRAADRIPAMASPALLASIRDFVHSRDTTTDGRELARRIIARVAANEPADVQVTLPASRRTVAPVRRDLGLSDSQLRPAIKL